MGLKKQHNKIDSIVLLILPIVAWALSLWFEVNFFYATLLFIGIPALWLTLRSEASQIKKSALFSLLFGIPLITLVDYIATLDRAWFITETIFPVRFLGVVPFDDYIWGFLFLYLVVLFYEHFIDAGKKKRILGQRMRYFIIASSVALMVFVYLLLFQPAVLQVPYAYVLMGIIVLALPTITLLYYHRALIPKFLKLIPYFVYLTVFHELTALHLHQWEFPGDHLVGWVHIGQYTLPLEEFIFFFFFGAIGIATYFEFFDDDGK